MRRAYDLQSVLGPSLVPLQLTPELFSTSQQMQKHGINARTQRKLHRENTPTFLT